MTASRPSTCKLCNARIWWTWGRGGRLPINLDGSDHRKTCTKSEIDRLNKEKTAKVQAEGVPFEDREGSGYVYQGRKKYFHRPGKAAAGEHYRPIQHRQDCAVPPWESCDCGQTIGATA